MTPTDFVYNSIFKGALAKGAKERDAHKHALLGTDEYKKGKIAKKVSDLIEAHIKAAKAGL